MSEIYTVIVVILGILAVSGLFVGVSNDAVNFLNSAIGSKAAPMKTILLVASIGILLGTVTSSGMMEVARNGMFNPGLFSFHEVMMLYMGVMFANVILLDLYNSMGLPTSTTVSLIFCLLGAAVAVSIYKISNDGALGMGDLNHFINTGRAMGIVSAILLSVVIAFTFGTLIMYISRLIFSFRYTAMFRRFGAFWCGASFTAILYFAVFKGLKTPLAGSAAIEWIDQHILLSLFLCWAVGSLLLFFLQRLKINILRLTILSGTFALALAFAGNDLVNFIGVPVAGFDAYSIARHAGDSTILMEGLNASVPANFLVLMTAGVIMIVTLWTSKKAMHVTETEISLSTQGESETQYGSSLFSRTIVRAALNASNAIDRTIPKRIRDKISSRFQYEDIEHSGAPYDMIRATVNLTTSAMLISVATSLKLPLSTTYVCFMVAMGSSLADKAWGRESAVYRISGVMTVVAGWFITAVGGFLIALAMGLILIYGGIAAFVVTTLLCGYMLVKSNFFKKNKAAETAAVKAAETGSDIIYNITQEVCATMERTTRIYDRTLIAVFKENRKVLREMVRESNELFYQSRERKYSPAAHPAQTAERRHRYGSLLRAGGGLSERNDQGAGAHHPSGVRTYRQQPRGTLERADRGPDAHQRRSGVDLPPHQQHAAHGRLLRPGHGARNARPAFRGDRRRHQVGGDAYQREPLQHQGQHPLPDDPERNQRAWCFSRATCSNRSATSSNTRTGRCSGFNKIK